MLVLDAIVATIPVVPYDLFKRHINASALDHTIGNMEDELERIRTARRSGVRPVELGRRLLTVLMDSNLPLRRVT
jgi:hypothetical protein